LQKILDEENVEEGRKDRTLFDAIGEGEDFGEESSDCDLGGALLVSGENCSPKLASYPFVV
jgi:hypothetical protein